MKVLILGGSRNIGYYSAIKLLEQGATVTFLLRSPSAFDKNETIQKYVASGQAHLVKGDTLQAEDMRAAWQIAGQGEGVDALIFSIGGTPSYSLTKGLVMSPPNLCAQSLLNTLTTLPKSNAPKIIVVTSNGLTKESHGSLPVVLKPIYGHLLDGPHGPHIDKLGAERLLAHCTGREWADPEPTADILQEGWERMEELPQMGSLKANVVVVRPALLTDGDCRADKGGNYRRAEGNLECAYRISRKDVAHFVVEDVLKNWSQWNGKLVSVAY